MTDRATTGTMTDHDRSRLDAWHEVAEIAGQGV